METIKRMSEGEIDIWLDAIKARKHQNEVTNYGYHKGNPEIMKVFADLRDEILGTKEESSPTESSDNGEAFWTMMAARGN